ncbi:integrase core domain-containing protein [Hymenobacter defluvii]|uniref:Integrase core domain-containing protein n=1 Tax=Hymenobacter defluvii TaxID=2054411 RepID=A0ABS3TEB7_9BACT|nr:integrase core domain-containing protein [Hymenobacter defluvii]
MWSRLKTELLNGGSFPSLTEARLEVSYSIVYYNAGRRHAVLSYRSPE